MERNDKLRHKSYVDGYSHFSKTGTDVLKDKNKIDAQKEAEGREFMRLWRPREKERWMIWF